MTNTEFEQYLKKKKSHKLYFLKHLALFESFLHRQVWEYLFEQPVKVDVMESVLNEGEICRFAIHTTPEIINHYVHK